MSASLLKRRSGAAAQRAVGLARRHFRVRKNVNGTAERPRLVVTRSLRHIVAQVVDDTLGHTLASASSLDATVRGTEGDKKAVAAKVGALIADKDVQETGIIISTAAPLDNNLVDFQYFSSNASIWSISRRIAAS